MFVRIGAFQLCAEYLVSGRPFYRITYLVRPAGQTLHPAPLYRHAG